MQTDSTQAAHELGDASFYLHDYHFDRIIIMESAPCSRKTDKAMEISIRFNRQMDYSYQPEAGYHTPQWNANMRSIKSW